jgi:hypothetical protein
MAQHENNQTTTLAPLGERVASPFALPLRTALSAAKGLRVNSASRVRGFSPAGHSLFTISPLLAFVAFGEVDFLVFKVVVRVHADELLVGFLQLTLKTRRHPEIQATGRNHSFLSN